MNYGVQNEFDFVNMFNNKYYSELNEKAQLFLKELFSIEFFDDEKIVSWKNRHFQKADIFVKYKTMVKSISLKCGNSNSIHSESVQDFKRYLIKLNVPYKIIDYYLSYHYGYMRNEEGYSDYSKVLSAKEYKELYQDELDFFNGYINKTKIVVDMIDRFLIRGNNSDYDIDALISGKPDDFVWILKYDLYDLILSKRDIGYTSPHIGCLTIGPRKRNIYGQRKYPKDRYIVCVRWNFLKEDIIGFSGRR